MEADRTSLQGVEMLLAPVVRCASTLDSHIEVGAPSRFIGALDDFRLVNLVFIIVDFEYSVSAWVME